MDIHLWKAGLDVVEQFFVPLKRERRVEPALHEDLIATDGNHLLDLCKQRLPVEHVALGMLRTAIERAEVADRRADVRVVDVAVDVVRAIRLGVEPPRHRVGRPPDGGQFPRLEQLDRVRELQPATRNGVVQDAPDRSDHDL